MKFTSLIILSVLFVAVVWAHDKADNDKEGKLKNEVTDLTKDVKDKVGVDNKKNENKQDDIKNIGNDVKEKLEDGVQEIGEKLKDKKYPVPVEGVEDEVENVEELICCAKIMKELKKFGAKLDKLEIPTCNRRYHNKREGGKKAKNWGLAHKKHNGRNKDNMEKKHGKKGKGFNSQSNDSDDFSS